MAWSDTPHVVRLVEAVQRHAHKDTELQMTVKKGQISLGVVRNVKGDTRQRQITMTYGGGKDDINDIALDVLEGLAEQALMQVSSYKDPYEDEKRRRR